MEPQRKVVHRQQKKSPNTRQSNNRPQKNARETTQRGSGNATKPKARAKKTRGSRTNQRQIQVTNANKRLVKREERTTKVVLFMLVFLFVALGVGTIYNVLTTERPPTMAVELQVVSAPQMSRGVVVRDEVVYTTDMPGDFTFHVEENTRIRPDTLVATVRNTEVVQRLEEENDELTLAVLSLQNSRAAISSQSDNAEILNAYIRERTTGSRIDNADSARALADEINTQISIRNTLLLSETRGAVEPLAEQNRRNLNLISINQREIRATNGGIVSFHVDGLEQLDSESISELTPEMIASILYEEENHDYQMGTDGFRIVNSNTWKLAAFMDNTLAENLSLDRIVPIFIETPEDGFREVRATVTTYEVSQNGTFVVFTMSDFVSEFINDRMLNFTLDEGEMRGIQITKTSVVNRNMIEIPADFVEANEDENTVFVNVLVPETGEVVPVQIAPRTLRNQEVDENVVYVLQDFEVITLGTVVVKGDEMYTLSNLVTDTGVFRANNGVAAFVSIDTRNMIEKDEYLIIDLDLNQGRGGLNIHDRIVTDAQKYIIYDGRSVF